MWLPTDGKDVLRMFWGMFWKKYGRAVAFIVSAAFALWLFFGHC